MLINFKHTEWVKVWCYLHSGLWVLIQWQKSQPLYFSITVWSYLLSGLWVLIQWQKSQPLSFSRADKPHYIMQTPTAAVKNEWCVDFNMAKLAIGTVSLLKVLSEWSLVTLPWEHEWNSTEKTRSQSGGYWVSRSLTESGAIITDQLKLKSDRIRAIVIDQFKQKSDRIWAILRLITVLWLQLSSKHPCCGGQYQWCDN